MTDNVQPIRKKTLWQNVEMMESILGAMDELIECLPVEARAEHEEELETNRRVLVRLRARAEAVEGPRP